MTPGAVALVWPVATDGGPACVCGEYVSGSHEGLSICAERDTAVLAVSDGELTFVRVEPEDDASQWAVGLSCDSLDGLLIKYKHLDSVVDGLEGGGRVSVGDTLGYVGVKGDVALLELEGYTGPVERFDPSPYLDWSDVRICP